MDGILNINKPQNLTSYRVVALVKRLSGERRVGHAGTLDPLATGVLPVCLGQATRLVEFFADATKTYQAEIELGVTTDTYDATGKITARGDPSGISQEQLASALASFRGLTQQTPPMYSAVKHHGHPLYELARAGIEVARKSRPTRIDEIKLMDWQLPVVTVKVVCGKGTYIRSLAHDLGRLLGCGANLKSLIRLSYGPFTVQNAVSLPQLEDTFRHSYWTHFVHSIDTVLLHWQAVIVNDATEQIIRKGAPITLDKAITGGTFCRTYNLNGDFLGVLRFDPERGIWQPKKVFTA